jgi:tRNA dimethylallyltransferase
MNFEAMKPNIIVICGPTALGKTSMAIELAAMFNGEIIGADSMQIYRYMDIGTAKPSSAEQSRIPHHMIDIIDPDQHFDAQRYAQMAHDKIMELVPRDTVPFVVGGTGLYIKALVHGMFKAAPPDPEVRSRLKEQAENHGIEFLYKQLALCDPDAAKKIHPCDTYRVIRALEIYKLTGKTISEYHRAHRFRDMPYRVLKIGLHLDREQLYDRINHRVDTMIGAGFVEEVRDLLGRGYPPDLKSMQSIGYRHLVDYIAERLEWEQALQTMQRDTRRYAKRQMTWFKADPQIAWHTPGQLENMRRIIEKFLHTP